MSREVTAEPGVVIEDGRGRMTPREARSWARAYRRLVVRSELQWRDPEQTELDSEALRRTMWRADTVAYATELDLAADRADYLEKLIDRGGPKLVVEAERFLVGLSGGAQ